MRVLNIITGMENGGAESMLLKLVSNVDRSKVEPLVISLTGRGVMAKNFEAVGVSVFTCNFKRGGLDLIAFYRLLLLIRELRPNVVQTWLYHADLLGGLAARLLNVKHVVWNIRNSNLDKRLVKKSTLLVVKICAALSSWLPCRILTCSSQAKAVHVAAGYRADKIQVIPNGFDLDRFQPDSQSRLDIRAELGLPADIPLVGLMARYDAQKNHLGFVEAAMLIHQQMPEVHFVLAGAGIDSSNQALMAEIKSHGLDACMHLLGRRDDMPRLMAALDVLASSSYGEAFPNVLGEAMACGVPCVVTDVGDSADIVGDSGKPT